MPSEDVATLFLRQPLFREVQRFTQPWLWAGLLGSAAAAGYLGAHVFARGQWLWPDLAAGLAALTVLALPVFFVILRLDTEVREDGIYVCFVPFHRGFKRFGFDDLRSIEACRYSPILEYGGWGIRCGLRGWAYNVKGSMGIQLERVSGGRVLIGTQRPEEFMAAVEAAWGQSGGKAAIGTHERLMP